MFTIRFRQSGSLNFISLSISWVGIDRPESAGMPLRALVPRHDIVDRSHGASKLQPQVANIMQYRDTVHSQVLVTKFQMHVHSLVFPIADVGSTSSQCRQQNVKLLS